MQKKQIEFLDAPVSGGVKGAVEGNLSIMVGGKKEIYKKSLDILKSRRMIVFSERIKSTAKKLGFTKIEATQNPSDEDFADILFNKKF